jgi:hypothetical protein
MSFRSQSLNAVIAGSVITAAISSAIAPAQAGSLVDCSTTCNLGSMIANSDYFTVNGDKQYSDFRATFTGTFTVPLTANEIQVGSSSVDSGISFFFPGIATSGVLSNIVLEYTLTALNAEVIDSLGLSMVSGVANGGSVTINEGIFAGNTQVGSLSTFDTETTKKKSDFTLLSQAAKQVKVQKAIQINGGNGPFSIASLSIVNQAAKATPVPTPAMLPGLIGLGLTTLRRKQKATTASV